MQSSADPYDPAAVEQATRQFWRSRGLPPPDGTVGPANGPRVHQIIGTLASEVNPVALTQGGVLADVDARFFALTGRRTLGRLLVRPSREGAPDPRTAVLLEAAGAWAGGAGIAPRDLGHDASRVQAMVERLAASGILVRRESPLRSCPRCRVPRTLAGILYHEEEGPAYLVRFPLTGADPPVSLIVWTDAAWKLLGAPAVLAQGDAPYVIVRYRRRAGEERILVAKSCLPHLQSWLPGGDWEVVEELPGASLEGRAYDHPLGTESPMLGHPPAPCGQVHLSSEVTDSGTGFVALVPAHGAADAAASRALDLPGWPVLDHDLALTSSFRHKYQGLPVESGEAFVIRDLREGGYLFAELTVRRGVPRCAVCRTALVWETGSAWCLVPSALPATRLDLFARLIPGERAPPSTEVVPWPVSSRELVDDPLVAELRECKACHRLSAPGGSATCYCGGATQPHRRRLLPVFREALLAWADESPFPSGEAVRLYLPERRRVPTLIHHLVAMEAADAHPGELTLHALATLPQDPSLDDWLQALPRDATRASLVSLTATPRGGVAALVERRAQHAHRLRRYWTLAQSVASTARADHALGGIPPIASRFAELLEEDRALLSRFERTRRDVITAYEAGDAATGLRLLEQFFDGPLRTIYLPAAGRRLTGPAASRAPVLALLVHVLVTWSELYGPVAPFTTEAVSRLFVADGRSQFERPLTPILEIALDPALEERSKSWWGIVEATRRARRHLGVADSVAIPQVVLGARDEAQAAEFRTSSAVIGRVINADQVEVASPQLPWSGRKLQVTPVLPALQKVFGSGAPRVARILQGLSPPRVRDGIRSKTLEIAVEGRPVPIGPGMVEIVEQVPDGFLSFPWAGGELIVRVPGSTPSASGERPRILSADAFRVVRRIRQRMRWAVRPEGVRVVVVCATGALSEELVRLAPVLATSLGVPLFRVVATTDGFPLSETSTGRTGRGVPWATWVPGSRRPDAHSKERAARARQDRIRRAIRRDPTPEATAEIQSDPAVRRDAEIDGWVVRLDELVGRPLVGPSKLRAAWEAGIQQYDDLIHAPYERLSAVAGFGPVVAAEVIARAGGKVPVRVRPAALAGAGSLAFHVPSRPGPTDPVASEIAVSSVTAAPPEVGGQVPSPLGISGGAAAPTTRAETMEAPPAPAESEVRSASAPVAEPGRATPPDQIAPRTEWAPQATPRIPEGARNDILHDVVPVPVAAPEPESGHSPSPPTPEPASPPVLEPDPATVATGIVDVKGIAPEPDHPLTPAPPSEAELTVPREDAGASLPAEGDTGSPMSSPTSDERLASPAAEPITPPPPTEPPVELPPPDTTAQAPVEPVPSPPDEPDSGDRILADSVPLAAPDSPELAHPLPETVPPDQPVVEGQEPPRVEPTGEGHLPEEVSPAPSAPTESAPPLTESPPREVPAIAVEGPAAVEDSPSFVAAPEPAASGIEVPPVDETIAASPEPGVAATAPEPDLRIAPSDVEPIDQSTDSAPKLGIEPTETSPPAPEGVAASAILPDTSALPVEQESAEQAPETGAPIKEPTGTSAPPDTPLAVVEPAPLAPMVEETPMTPSSEPPPPPLAPSPEPPVPPETPLAPPLSEPTVTLPGSLLEVSAPPPLATSDVGAIPSVTPIPPPPASGLAVSSAALANDAWPLFLDATGAGHRGLCVSREFPDRMRALLGPRDVTIIWLSNSTRPGSVRPTDLESLALAVEKAVTAENVRAIYLDHVEYLARVNSTAAVRTLLERLDAIARAHEARAWVALNPSLLAADAAEVLTRDFPSAH